MQKRTPVENQYSIDVLRSIDELRPLKDVWNALQHHPNVDFDGYLTLLNSREEVEGPYVIALHLNGKPKAIFVGRVENRKLTFNLGYKKVLGLRARLIVIMYGGILGDPSRVETEAILTKYLEELGRGDADAVWFNSLPVDSELCNLIRKKPGFLSRDRCWVPNIHWRMAFPGSADGLLSKVNSKHRYWLRRMERLLNRDYPEKVMVRVFEKPEDVQELCRTAESIANTTYQRGLGVGFIDNEETRLRMKLLADKDALRTYMLYVENEPWAFWIGTLFRETFYLDYAGYDPSFRNYEPGSILFVKMMDHLGRDVSRVVKEVDFGFGDALYKQRFGDSHWEETSLYIFAPTLRGIALNAMRTAAAITSRLLVRAVGQLRLKDRLKRNWRERIRQRGTEKLKPLSK